ncbi:L-threonylcarbamoyladenylate synthase [Staphylococcus sp. 11261D007BR]
MKETHIWDVREYTHSLERYPKFNEILATFRDGGLVVLPTETVYGLGANALDETAIQNIYKAKGRPSDNPLIVHIYDRAQLDDFISHISTEVRQLMDAFWPGPITFILPLKKGYLSERVTGGLDSVAVRMPSHPIARQVLKALNLPVAAPSANLSGRPSPTTFEHAYHDLNHRVDGIIRSTQSDAGLESTVLDCTSYPFKVARPGTITRTMLNEVLPHSIDQSDVALSDKPIAPGMKYKHYAPNTPLVMIKHFNGPVRQDTHNDWENIAFIIPNTFKKWVPSTAKVLILSEDANDISTANHNLYSALHQLDTLDNVEIAYIYGYPESNQTEALHNRMLKACNHQIVEDETL